MPGESSIEWCDATWNPVTGCTRISPGCDHCYIERSVPFRVAGRKFELVGKQETTGVTLHPERLNWPSSRAPERLAEKLGRPIRVFVNSLSDLFHEEIPRAFVEEVFEAMDAAGDAIQAFQVLTKRPNQARRILCDRPATPDEVDTGFELGFVPGIYYDRKFPKVWLGVSIEQARFAWRADVLRKIPAAVKFISAEPLLGSLRGTLDLTGIDWLIVGGESGGRFARPMHPEWARELRDACLAEEERRFQYAATCSTPVECEHGYDVCPTCDGRPAFLFKQWGSYAPRGFVSGKTDVAERAEVEVADWLMFYYGPSPKSGGKILDGREWCEFPGEPVAVEA